MRKWIGSYMTPEGAIPLFIEDEDEDPQPTERKPMSTKRDELANPKSCLNRAAPDEPIFVIRAKDQFAAQTVRLWAAMAAGHHESEKTIEAQMLADEMDTWRDHNVPKATEAIPAPTYNPSRHR